MSILYSAVAQGPVVLARFAACAGNFQEVAEQLLGQVTLDVSAASRVTYTHGSYLTHAVLHQGIIYLCITDESVDRYRAFVFLEEVKTLFVALCSAKPGREPAPYVWNDDFAEVLAGRMEAHNKGGRQEDDDVGDDQITSLRSQVEDVQQTLVRNIEDLANRGERLELLVDKTTHLSEASITFRTQSTAVARRMWWKNTRLWLLVAVGVVLGVYVLGAAICGWSWNHCSSK